MQQTATFAIRQSHMSDVPSLYRICLETGLDGKDATGTVDPEILGHHFVGPYLALEPAFGFVLTMNGTPMGYIVGTADTHRFEARCEQAWWPALRQRYPMPDMDDGSRTANMIRAIHERAPGDPIAEDYPAHLHINLLPPAQGRGQGRGLIQTFVGRLKQNNIDGLHFSVSGKNTRAIAFYRHMGFEVLKEADFGVQMGCRL